MCFETSRASSRGARAFHSTRLDELAIEPQLAQALSIEQLDAVTPVDSVRYGCILRCIAAAYEWTRKQLVN